MPWETLLLSVVLYIVVPVVVAQIFGAGAARERRPGGARARCASVCSRCRSSALLLTLVLLFGFQGEQIVRQPLVIAMLAVPILIQVYFNAGSPICSTGGSASRIAWPGLRR